MGSVAIPNSGPARREDVRTCIQRETISLVAHLDKDGMVKKMG